MSIAERIKVIRKELNISQKAFGEKLGISRDSVNNLENGRAEPTELVIKAICREFGVSYDWLKGEDGAIWVTPNDESISGIIDELMVGENDVAKAIFRAFAKFDDRDWETIRKVAEEMQKK
jgi:transcriptional regulator with XRE-family HTH domain